MEKNLSELLITRIFNAPREAVWKAWTDPKEITKWWGPKEFTIPFCTVDLRVGGEWRYCMRAPNLGMPGADGRDYWGKGTYREIVRPERLVYTDVFTDESGTEVHATHYFGPDAGSWPPTTEVTATFEEQDGKTKMTMRHIGIPAGPHRDGAIMGWGQSFDKLAEILQ